MSLTGRFRHRRSFGGKLVLQVEEVRPRWLRRSKRPRWRDAKVMDLAAPELRTLIDLGKRALFLPRDTTAPSPAPRSPEGPADAEVPPAASPDARQPDGLPSVH
jgi:hypothetical protein